MIDFVIQCPECWSEDVVVVRTYEQTLESWHGHMSVDAIASTSRESGWFTSIQPTFPDAGKTWLESVHVRCDDCGHDSHDDEDFIHIVEVEEE